jgi:ferredoxin
MLYIEPNDCIDCGACLPECPVEAIYYEGDLPERYQHFAAVNAEQARRLPLLTEARKRSP